MHNKILQIYHRGIGGYIDMLLHHHNWSRCFAKLNIQLGVRRSLLSQNWQSFLEHDVDKLIDRCRDILDTHWRIVIIRWTFRASIHNGLSPFLVARRFLLRRARAILFMLTLRLVFIKTQRFVLFNILLCQLDVLHFFWIIFQFLFLSLLHISVCVEQVP